MKMVNEQHNGVFTLAKLSYLACNDTEKDFYSTLNIPPMDICDYCADALKIMKSNTGESDDKLGYKASSNIPSKYIQYYQYMLTVAEEHGHGFCMKIAKQQIEKFSKRPLQEDVHPPLSPFEVLHFEIQFQVD